MIKTAASVPCLRINSGLVKPGDVGRLSLLWIQRMSHGFVSLNTDLLALPHLEDSSAVSVHFPQSDESFPNNLVMLCLCPSGPWLCVNYYVVKPGPVLDFLCENQNVKHPDFIDWTKAKSVLKNLRIKVNNLEFKISGLSNNTCRTQK
ncbi:hypothetical protein Ahy_A05g024518 [Arachis hypogaea]|uniref:Uncharacterized protein n=1 Tax=Arachis hypogaea TaxID=3818 RepID=A0A445D5Z5_ARAHY|nr:hypothetical protein Ahy_A05g024518 [Arachis hypogaea]